MTEHESLKKRSFSTFPPFSGNQTAMRKELFNRRNQPKTKRPTMLRPQPLGSDDLSISYETE